MKKNSIKEDIEYAKDVIALAKLLPTGEIKIQEEEIEVIEHILSDYKRVLKENEELKNQEATQRKINELLVQRYSNSIPVQKVKDKIEEIKERKMDIVMSQIHNRDEKIEILKKDKIRIQVLQELLERNKTR